MHTDTDTRIYRAYERIAHTYSAYGRFLRDKTSRTNPPRTYNTQQQQQQQQQQQSNKTIQQQKQQHYTIHIFNQHQSISSVEMTYQ
jgi:hypothetical protein